MDEAKIEGNASDSKETNEDQFAISKTIFRFQDSKTRRKRSGATVANQKETPIAPRVTTKKFKMSDRKDIAITAEVHKTSDSSAGSDDTSTVQAISNACMRHNCFICKISFRYDNKYEKHCKELHGIYKPYACAECKTTYAKRNYLLKHFVRSVAHSKLYKKREMSQSVFCEICKRDIEGGLMSFNDHVRSLHPGMNIMPCSHCTKKFSNRKTLTEHVRLKHFKNALAPTFQCAFCKNMFDRTDELKGHQILCEQRQMKKRQGHIALNFLPNFKNFRLRCDECRGFFESFALLKKHYKNVHPDVKLHTCYYCGENYSENSYLEKHIDMKHPDRDDDVINQRRFRNKIYKCQHCEKQFRTMREYEVHGREHPGKVMFYCELCGKEFSNRRSLKFHSNEVHTDFELKTRCEYCRKTYYNFSSFIKHVVSCKKKTENISKLRETGVAGIYCEICEKFFDLSRYAFQKHVIRHSKYDLCTLCDQGFDRSQFPTGLAEHMKSKHPSLEEIKDRVKGNENKMSCYSYSSESSQNEEVAIKREIKEEEVEN